MQKGFGVLVVSNFSLYGVLKGNKPDFHKSLAPEESEPLYN
jgi:D-tyrosyl-tRNA(Tyr) deacylase